MKIAFVVHDYHRTGGHSRYVAELAERFALEHEVHVLANGYNSGLPFYPTPAIPGRRLFLHQVWAWRASALGTVLSFFLPASWKLRSLGKFDIVHAQGFACLGATHITAHICCAAWHAKRLESGYRLHWKERVFDAVVIRLEKALYRGAVSKPVIAISHRVDADLREHYGFAGIRRIIPHGVDAGEFDIQRRDEWRREVRGALGIEGNRFVALWVGDLRKGAKTALESVSRNPGQILLTVSRNSPEPFQALAGKLGILDRVHFLPPTNQIARYYAAADVFLFPTAYDAFGMVVLEAMAMGLPVIVSRAAGAAELIAHGHNGVLLERPFDPEESAEWLRRLERDSPARRFMGEAALAVARANDWDRVAALTMDMYRETGACAS